MVILLLALIVLGPEKLPDAIRRFGRIYGELRKMGTGFQSEFRNAFDEPMRELRETAQLTRDAVMNPSPIVSVESHVDPLDVKENGTDRAMNDDPKNSVDDEGQAPT